MTDVKLSILLDAKQKTDAAFASVRNNMQSLAKISIFIKPSRFWRNFWSISMI